MSDANALIGLTPREIEGLVIKMPCSFASYASGGRWLPYRWIQHISRRVTPKINEGDGRFLIEAPPQHGKSEFISHWLPTWYLKNNPRGKVILASYASTYAEKWGAKVREELTLNPRCAIPMRTDTKAKSRFMTKEGGYMIATGIGGPITGEGADLLIIDDPFKNYEEAMSERIRERNSDWYRSVCRTRLQPGATVVILHTRWHENDLIGELNAEGGWDRIRFPALAEEEGDPIGRKPGEALCRARYDEAALNALRVDLGPMIWEALFQQNPVAIGGNIIHGDWIKRYDALPKDMDEIAIFSDLTYQEGQENDFAVIEAWGRRGANIYLITQIRRQMGFKDQMDAIIRMKERYPTAYHVEIEEAANGAAVIEMLKQKIPGIYPNKPRTSKEARLNAVAPIYQAGNVWYPNEHTNPWVKTNITEVTKFPRWKNDDTVDVASMAVGHFGRFCSSLQRLAALGRR